MKKTAKIILIVLILIFGYLFVGYWSFATMGTYYGYNGYCSQTKLQYFVAIKNSEALLALILIAYYVFLELFQKFKTHIKFYPTILLILLLNLVFMGYKIVEYPILLRDHGWFREVYLQKWNNPLIFISIIYSLVIIWMNYRFQVKTKSLKKFSILTLIVIITSSILITIAFLNTEYEICRG